MGYIRCANCLRDDFEYERDDVEEGTQVSFYYCNHCGFPATVYYPRNRPETRVESLPDNVLPFTKKPWKLRRK